MLKHSCQAASAMLCLIHLASAMDIRSGRRQRITSLTAEKQLKHLKQTPADVGFKPRATSSAVASYSRTTATLTAPSTAELPKVFCVQRLPI